MPDQAGFVEFEEPEYFLMNKCSIGEVGGEAVEVGGEDAGGEVEQPSDSEVMVSCNVLNLI